MSDTPPAPIACERPERLHRYETAVADSIRWDSYRPRPGDIIVVKRHWGAFTGTELDLQLRRRGVTQIVLAGISTSIGVESTARSAYDYGYHVVLITDAMTDRSDEAHRHSAEQIFPRLGETDTTENVLKFLRKAAARS